MNMLALGIDLAERGFAPDWATRAVIRRLCGERVRDARLGDAAVQNRALDALIAQMAHDPIAPAPAAANAQHYELPAEFFVQVLGRRQKYSCCYWDADATTLDQAEEAALAATCARADLADGQDVLELGCGWGSLSLWMAERYPGSRITAVSNSRSQRLWIESRAAAAGVRNLRVVTADMNDLDAPHGAFDRVVSVEMFEHMRNYDRLLERIRGWMRAEGKLFVHIFCHRELAYPYETAGAANWMGRYFFTGGLMPSETLLNRFARHLTVTQRWRWSGRHYQRTAEAWLANLDRRRSVILPILAQTYGRRDADRWLQRWRLFFLAVAEMFGMHRGAEWFVSHALLEPARERSR